MIKKKGLFIIVFTILTSCIPLSVHAQTSCNPGDAFYIIAQSWELRGVVDRIPSIRPFPVAVIKSILNEVMEKGTPEDKDLAEYYYKTMFDKPWSLQVEVADTVKLVYGDNDTANQLSVSPTVNGDLSFMDDLISIGFKIGNYDTTKAESGFLPWGYNFTHDAIQDAAELGPFLSYLDGNTCVAIGNPNFYMQTGVYRTGFGPFINEGLALNDSAYHMSNFMFHIDQKKWAFSQQLSVIGATTNAGSDLTYNKYMAFHALDFFVTNKLTITYYETIIYGRRFDPSYLFPTPYMVTQGINGNNDNLYMGLCMSYKFFPGFSLNTDLFVDDLSVNDLVKFNIDSKNRIAMETGVIYAPEKSICSRMAMNYTIVTPYTYSHWDYDDPTASATMSSGTFNYQNYTNNGMCFGSSYPPNSDRISCTLDLRPIRRLHVQITSSIMRHGNVCESFTDEEATKYLLADKGVYATDGSVFTHSMFQNTSGTSGTCVDTAWNHLNFLTQDHKMYIVQTGFSADYILDRYKWGQVSFKASYLFEYIKNKGVDTNLYEGGNATDNKNGTYTWKGTTYSSAADLVNAAKALWVSNFCDVIDNYFSFGVVFKY